jgi:hypothetical protein
MWGCPPGVDFCLMTTFVPISNVLTCSDTVRLSLPRSFLELPLNVPLEFLTISNTFLPFKRKTPAGGYPRLPIASNC